MKSGLPVATQIDKIVFPIFQFIFMYHKPFTVILFVYVTITIEITVSYFSKVTDLLTNGNLKPESFFM